MKATANTPSPGSAISLSIPKDEIRNMIQGVLETPLSRILPVGHSEASAETVWVLFSGHLGESSHLHSLAKEYFRQSNVKILPSRDE